MDLVRAEHPGHRVRLGHDLEQLQVELAGDALERPEMHERRERVEDADLDVAALEADRIGQRVAVDAGPGDRGVDQPDVDVGQAGLPGDRSLGLAERLALHGVDEPLELGLRDRRVGLLALLGVGGGEALDQLAGDPDDDLRRPEAGHLLGLLERDRAVVDDRRDVGDGARLHVGQALPLAPDATDRAVAVLVDLEHERLGELGPHVERRAGRQRGFLIALPDPAPERHLPARLALGGADLIADGGFHGRERVGQAGTSRTLALGHLRPAATAPIDGRSRRGDECTRGDAAAYEIVTHADEELWLLGIEAEGDDTRREYAAEFLGGRLERLDRVVGSGERDKADAGDRFGRSSDEVRRLG